MINNLFLILCFNLYRNDIFLDILIFNLCDYVDFCDNFKSSFKIFEIRNLEFG